MSGFPENGSTWYYRVFHAYPQAWARSLPSQVDWFKSVVGGVPEVPSLRWPRDGDNAGGTSINFEWYVPRYGLEHSVQVECEGRQLVSGRIGVVGPNGPGVPGQPISNYRVDDLFFDNGESCRWRVAGINERYTGSYSPWTSFTNGPSGIPEPSRIDSPTSWQEFEDGCFEVVFTQELRAQGFEIMVSSDPNDFSTTVTRQHVSRITTQYQQAARLCLPQDAGGSYYLMVVAQNSAGQAQSEVRPFKVKKRELCPFRVVAQGKDLYGRNVDDLHFCYDPAKDTGNYGYDYPYFTMDTFYRRQPPPFRDGSPNQHNHVGVMDNGFPGNELAGSIVAVGGWKNKPSLKDGLIYAFDLGMLGNNAQIGARKGAVANKWAGMVYDYWLNIHQTGLSSTIAMASIVGLDVSFVGMDENNVAVNCRFEDNADSGAFVPGTVGFGDSGPLLLHTESSADTAWHEWGHNLLQSYEKIQCSGNWLAECGALQEAFGDLNSAAASAYWGWYDPWLIGDDHLNRPVLRNIRNPADPTARTQMPSVYLGDNWYPSPGQSVEGCRPQTPTCATENDPPTGGDDCGVHKNSGVFSRAFFCMAEGCNQNGVSAYVGPLGIRWTHGLALRSAKECWRGSPSFRQAATCMYDTAGAMFGSGSTQQQVLLSFQAAGIPVDTPPPTPTPTPTPVVICTGDCDRGGSVTVDELLRMINIILGLGTSSACTTGDYNGDGVITIDELTRAVWAATSGRCTTVMTAASSEPSQAGSSGVLPTIETDWVNSSAGSAGTTLVTLKNTGGQVTAIQFDLGLPDGLFDQRRCLKNPFLPHNLHQQGNRFVLVDTDDPTASLPDTFPLLGCSYRIVANAEPGGYPVMLENVVASTAAGERFDLATQSGGLYILPPDGSAPRLAGSTSYYANGQPVSGVDMELRGPVLKSATTGTNGQYQSSILLPGEWKITPRKQGDQETGISALDAVYVLQAAVGARALTVEQQLACDVSGNGSASALDAAYILQKVVGLRSQFPAAQRCGSDWLFVPQPSGSGTTQTTSPVLNNTSCTMGSIARQVGGAVIGQDFRAMLLGDCTGNWAPSIGAGAGFAPRRFVLDNTSEDDEYARRVASRVLRKLERVSEPDRPYETMSRWDKKRVEKALQRLTRYLPTPTPTPFP